MGKNKGNFHHFSSLPHTSRSHFLERKQKKNKPPKDENAPKKGKSAFLYYVEAKKDGYKAANPDLKHKEVISKLSKQWNELAAGDKKPFQDLAEADKERFKKEKEAYVNSKKDSETKKKGKKGKDDDEGKGSKKRKVSNKGPVFSEILVY